MRWTERSQYLLTVPWPAFHPVTPAWLLTPSSSSHTQLETGHARLAPKHQPTHIHSVHTILPYALSTFPYHTQCPHYLTTHTLSAALYHTQCQQHFTTHSVSNRISHRIKIRISEYSIRASAVIIHTVKNCHNYEAHLTVKMTNTYAQYVQPSQSWVHTVDVYHPQDRRCKQTLGSLSGHEQWMISCWLHDHEVLAAYNNSQYIYICCTYLFNACKPNTGLHMNGKYFFHTRGKWLLHNSKCCLLLPANLTSLVLYTC